MKTVSWPFLILVCFFTACAPGNNFEAKSVATTTYSPATPTVSQEGDYSVVHGATEVQNMTTQYEASKKGLTLSGKVEVKPIDGTNPFEVILNLEGQVDQEGFAVMKAGAKQASLPPEVKMGAKATCLGENNECTSSFIDIYIQYRNHVYHHQVESHEESAVQAPAKEIGAALAPSPAPGKVDDKHTAPAKTPVVVTPASKPADPKAEAKLKADDSSATNANDDEESDEGQDEPDAKGRYLGDIAGDIATILEGKVVDKSKLGISSKLDQVVDHVNKGHLEHATSLMDYIKSHASSGLEIVHPERKTYFASYELVYLLGTLGTLTTKGIIPNYSLKIGDVSREKGGQLFKHASHQNGLDADIAFYFKDTKNQGGLFSALDHGKSGKPIDSWMPEEQWKLFKYAVDTKYVDRIFIHPNLKEVLCNLAIKKGDLTEEQTTGDAYEALRRLREEKNHYNHFHLRIKCAKNQVRCRQLADPPQGTGCF